jgi:hypothetical protein
VSRQRGVVLEGFDGRIDGAAAIVTKHEDQRHAEHGDGIFHAGDGLFIGEVSGNATDE